MQNEIPWLHQIHPLARIRGRDATAAQLLQSTHNVLPIQALSLADDDPSASNDYAQIDPALSVARPRQNAKDFLAEPPSARLGYAGYSPQQRYRFLRWLRDPRDDSADAFRQLFLAQLECALFDAPQQSDAYDLLDELTTLEHWRSERLYRARLLAHWLAQDAAALASWLAQDAALPTSLFDIGLGHLALLGYRLDAELLSVMRRRWLAEAAQDEAAESTLRLASLLSAVEEEPLAWALRQSQPGAEDEPPTAQFPGESVAKPWRSTHRDLRLSLPQPILRPRLEPILRDVFSIRNASPAVTIDELAEENLTDEEWLLVLEFGQSRSEYFEYALAQARKRSGFAQILDEKRQMVYRVAYRKREMRHFWRLWEYAQNWSSTRVYLNGREMQKWQIWRYSHYLR